MTTSPQAKTSPLALWQRIEPYWQLMRFHKPIGTLLLLWPTVLALVLAADGLPPLSVALVFGLGVVLMRACGCVINDIADRRFDGQVARTKTRPLATGVITLKAALLCFGVLALLAFALVLTLNRTTIYLSFGALAIASAYPFMKRHTYFPQVVLGAAFAWAIPMAFTALERGLPPLCWLLYVSTLLWVLAYDTLYGMVDRADDLNIGIKSTAILFGEADVVMVSAIHGLALIGWLMVGAKADLGGFWYAGVSVAAVNVAAQMWHVRRRAPAACFQAFLWNNYYGMALALGLVLDRVVMAD